MSRELPAKPNLEHLKELGVNYIVLPMHAPARLLALEVKDLEVVISVPMQEGDMYPLFIRNLTAFDNIAAVRLDFSLAGEASTMTIEDVLHYRGVREAAVIARRNRPNVRRCSPVLALSCGEQGKKFRK